MSNKLKKPIRNVEAKKVMLYTMEGVGYNCGWGCFNSSGNNCGNNCGGGCK